MSFLSAWYYNWNIDRITLKLDVQTDLGSLDVSFDGSNENKLERLLLGISLGYTNGKVIGSDEGIKLGLSCGKLFGNIVVNVDGTTLGIYVGTNLGSLFVSFDGSNDNTFEGLLIWVSLGYPDGKVLGSNEQIKLGYTDGIVLGAILGNVDGITVGRDVETGMGSLDGYFIGSNDDKLEGLLLGGSLRYTDYEVLGSDEGIKLWLLVGKVLGTILGKVYGITLGLDVVTKMGFLDVSFDGSNDDKLEGLLFGGSMTFTDGKVLGTILGM